MMSILLHDASITYFTAGCCCCCVALEFPKKKKKKACLNGIIFRDLHDRSARVRRVSAKPSERVGQ
jgi:hypothetical protein